MIVGLDYWQVVSHYPDYFKMMSRALISYEYENNQVHIVSAVGKDRVGTVAGEVAKLGIAWDPETFIHEVVFDHPSQSPELKLAKCLELGITVFYDDRDDVCRLLNKHGIMAMRVTRRDNSTYDLGAEQSATTNS